ncbi:hypothetical protein BW014_12380 [Salmonella enterica]|uniref:DNA-binding protein n=1 Tax=Salmonella enterica subsp. enterica serovar Rough O:d:1,7 TaxID=1974323 RepID=A0A974KDV2_SALET|nr:hypothetical protein [Salmonella enterica]ECC9937400.1 hypothetical protein [Salmonella enterica subsp. enterica]ECG3783118.1 hypothetical protein [Salmonella enterica subsp. enterica serovar Florida]EDL0223019.1 hypothetical protein [Salmonella enterica subsp. diarizonae]EIE2750072.1 hypothetical protein [Salmonella enterica subsp. diarizonae serovar 48:i:z]EAS1836537.1 hypothetical protein [Salmonella enterica]
MAYNPSGLHLEIAEWILEQGRAVTVNEVAQRFRITKHQATGFFMILSNDAAIKSQGVIVKSSNSPDRLNKRRERTIMITAINREKIMHRYSSARGNSYEHHPVESVSELSPDKKWKWIISHSGRQKDES